MRVSSVSSTYCFVLSGDQLAQVVRVVVAEAPAGTSATVSLEGPQLLAATPWRGHRPRTSGSGRRAGLGAQQRPWARQPREVHAATTAAGRRCSRSAHGGGADQRRGSVVRVRAVAEAGSERAEAEADVVVREPGWRMLMVSHFHYDPVWWNTQAGYTSGWDELLWAQDKRETVPAHRAGPGGGAPATGARRPSL